MSELGLVAGFCGIGVCLVLSVGPVVLGVCLLCMAIISGVIVSLLSSSWYGLALIIVYVGGLLVMFSYFVSLTSNAEIDAGFVFIGVVGSSVLFYSGWSMMPNWQMYNIVGEAVLSLGALYESGVLYYLIFLAIILLVALVVVVSVTKVGAGPLRGQS